MVGAQGQSLHGGGEMGSEGWEKVKNSPGQHHGHFCSLLNAGQVLQVHRPIQADREGVQVRALCTSQEGSGQGWELGGIRWGMFAFLHGSVASRKWIWGVVLFSLSLGSVRNEHRALSPPRDQGGQASAAAWAEGALPVTSVSPLPQGSVHQLCGRRPHSDRGPGPGLAAQRLPLQRRLLSHDVPVHCLHL